MTWLKLVLLYGIPLMCLAFYLGHRLYYKTVARRAVRRCADAVERLAGECEATYRRSRNDGSSPHPVLES